MEKKKKGWMNKTLGVCECIHCSDVCGATRSGLCLSSVWKTTHVGHWKCNPSCRYTYRIHDSVGCLHHGFSVEEGLTVTVEGCRPYLWQGYRESDPQIKSVTTRLTTGARDFVLGASFFEVRGRVTTALSHHCKTARASTSHCRPLHWEYPRLVEFRSILSVCVCVCVCMGVRVLPFSIFSGTEEFIFFPSLIVRVGFQREALL